MLNVTGLNEMSKKFEDLANKATALSEMNQVPITELLNPTFLAKHTRFADADELFEASGFKFETQEDLAAIPDDKWDEFIRSISSYPDWISMLNDATKEWAVRELGF